jgi:hypothetical protein
MTMRTGAPLLLLAQENSLVRSRHQFKTKGSEWILLQLLLLLLLLQWGRVFVFFEAAITVWALPPSLHVITTTTR